MNIAVFGYGTMGKGITQVFAQQGHTVHLVGYDLKKVRKAKKDLEKSILELVAKKEFSKQQAKDCLEHIHPCVGADFLAECELIIEAVPEKKTLKQQLFRKISNLCKEKTIIATNTSSLSVTELAKSCRHPERFIGMHFFNPAAVMPLVEVVKAKKTSDKTYKKSSCYCKKRGQTTSDLKRSTRLYR